MWFRRNVSPPAEEKDELESLEAELADLQRQVDAERAEIERLRAGTDAAAGLLRKSER